MSTQTKNNYFLNKKGEVGDTHDVRKPDIYPSLSNGEALYILILKPYYSKLWFSHFIRGWEHVPLKYKVEKGSLGEEIMQPRNLES